MTTDRIKDTEARAFINHFLRILCSYKREIRLFSDESGYSFLLSPNYKDNRLDDTYDCYIQVNLGKDGEDDFRVAGSLEKKGIKPCFIDFPGEETIAQIVEWMSLLKINKLTIPKSEDVPGFEFFLEGGE